ASSGRAEEGGRSRSPLAQRVGYGTSSRLTRGEGCSSSYAKSAAPVVFHRGRLLGSGAGPQAAWARPRTSRLARHVAQLLPTPGAAEIERRTRFPATGGEHGPNESDEHPHGTPHANGLSWTRGKIAQGRLEAREPAITNP